MGPENPLITELRKALAEYAEVKLLLVGGSVRDILLAKPLVDYDFLLEGELFSFAKLLSERLRCKVVFNHKLLTASMVTPWGELDLSRARKEIYQSPGALPEVSPASWQEDLPRRDFTINTLLLPLNQEGWGEVMDPLGGIKDLQAGLIRILHPRSFQDDPTRLLRALRLKNRLGFTWAEETLARLKKDWPCLNLVSPARRLKEWRLICEEEELQNILQELYQLGGWPAFFSSLPYSAESVAGLEGIRQEAGSLKLRAWFLILLILLAPYPNAAESLSRYWGFSLQDSRSLEQTMLILAELRQGLPIKQRMIYRRIKQLPLESVFYVYRQSFSTAYSWNKFWQLLQDTRMPIRGKDLLKLGFAPGLMLGRLLAELEDAYWQEEYNTREEGLKLACTLK